MRQVFINGRYLTQAVTGVQRCAIETVRALDLLVAQGEYVGQGWSFTVLVPPSLRVHPTFARLPVRVVGWGRGQLWEQVELPIHARRGLLLSLANVAPIAVRHQCVTIHDASVFAVPHAYRLVFRTWYRFLIPTLGRRAERILTDSRFSRDELIHKAGIPAAKLAVVPLAGEHILSVPADNGVFRRHQLGSRPYLVTVGSDAPHKNLGSLARAVELVPQKDYDVVMAGGRNATVFGNDPSESAGRIRRLGYVTDGELRALYEQATCLVFPSLYEGFGLPALEAMACGCPVIASDAASLPEVCGDAALYCDARDPRDIAARISDVLTRPELRQDLSARARARAGGFRWTATARAVMAEIEGVVRGPDPMAPSR